MLERWNKRRCQVIRNKSVHVTLFEPVESVLLGLCENLAVGYKP
jgi:hypothetical protein